MRAAALALVLLAGCGDSGVDPLSLAVDERGPFNVGLRTWDVTYQHGGISEARTILLHMWYPTEDADGNNPRYEGLFQDDDVFEDATPAAPIHEGGYPVLVHSHGHRGYAGNSADIFSYLASHGWVVIAPNHTGNTLLEGDDRPTSIYFLRSVDITVSIDALSSVELAGPIATDRVVMSGHSFGTFTTWASANATFDETVMRPVCETGELSADCTEADLQIFLAGVGDSRIVAAMPMAGGDRGWFGTGGYETVTAPVLYMTGSDDPVGAAELFDLVSTVDLTWIDIEGGCHQLFGLGGCDMVSDAEGFPIVNTFALAFARRHLLGDDSADVAGVLDGSREVSPRVSLQRK